MTNSLRKRERRMPQHSCLLLECCLSYLEQSSIIISCHFLTLPVSLEHPSPPSHPVCICVCLCVSLDILCTHKYTYANTQERPNLTSLYVTITSAGSFFLFIHLFHSGDSTPLSFSPSLPCHGPVRGCLLKGFVEIWLEGFDRLFSRFYCDILGS